MLAERRVKWCHEYVDARKNAWKTLCDMKEDNFDSAFAVDAFHRYGVRMSGRKIAKEVLEERMKSDPLLAGCVLLNGEFGVEKNLEEALAQFSRSRDPRARFYEGRMFFRGEGVKMDIPRAVRLFHEAAAGNVPDAIFALAPLYMSGLCGVEQNLLKAAMLYEQAAALSEAIKGGSPAFFFSLLRSRHPVESSPLGFWSIAYNDWLPKETKQEIKMWLLIAQRVALFPNEVKIHVASFIATKY